MLKGVRMNDLLQKEEVNLWNERKKNFSYLLEKQKGNFVKRENNFYMD